MTTISQPKYTTSTTLTYTTGNSNGLYFPPGSVCTFTIPPNFQNQFLNNITLIHRKPQENAAVMQSVGADGYDSQGAYNEVTVQSTDGSIRTWGGPGGAKKFAEPRSAGDPENENLYEWAYYSGTFGISSVIVKNTSTAALAVSHLHGIVVGLLPPQGAPGISTTYQEEIYTPGTSFAQVASHKPPSYGGGQAAGFSLQQLQANGLYPGAARLGPGIPGGHYGQLIVDGSGVGTIKLNPGQTFAFFEISVGDTFLDTSKPVESQINKDKHYGVLGYAKISVSLVNAGTVKGGSPFIYQVNVGPNGVIAGGPITSNYVVVAGDVLRIQSDYFQSHVMGYRITYNSSAPQPPPLPTAKTLLWVDDNPQGNQALAQKAYSLGVVVVQVSSTQAAVTYLNQNPSLLSQHTNNFRIVTDGGRYEGTEFHPNAYKEFVQILRTTFSYPHPVVLYTSATTAQQISANEKQQLNLLVIYDGSIDNWISFQ